MGVCVKLASAHYDAGEIVFYRGMTERTVDGDVRALERRNHRDDGAAMHFWRSLSG